MDMFRDMYRKRTEHVIPNAWNLKEIAGARDT